MKSALSRLLVLAVLLVVAALLYVVTDATQAIHRLEGVTAVHCDKTRRQVLVAAWGEVRIFDEAGRPLGRLRDRSGRATRVSGVSSISVDANGFVQSSIEHESGRFLLLDTLDPGQASGLYCRRRQAWLREFEHPLHINTNRVQLHLNGLDKGGRVVTRCYRQRFAAAGGAARFIGPGSHSFP